MKHLVKVVIFILLVSCQVPTEKPKCKRVVKKETVIQYVNSGVNVEGMKTVKVFPVEENKSTPLTKGDITEKKEKSLDFADGIMYDENSFPIDSLVHTIDLSSIVGNKESIVYFMVKWVDGCADETFTAYFKPHTYDVNYRKASCKYGEPAQLVDYVVGEDCLIDWYHDYTWQFLHSGVLKAIKIEIWCIFYTNGTVVL